MNYIREVAHGSLERKSKLMQIMNHCGQYFNNNVEIALQCLRKVEEDEHLFDAAHAAMPTKPMFASECCSCYSTNEAKSPWGTGYGDDGAVRGEVLAGQVKLYVYYKKQLHLVHHRALASAAINARDQG